MGVFCGLERTCNQTFSEDEIKPALSTSTGSKVPLASSDVVSEERLQLGWLEVCVSYYHGILQLSLGLCL